MMIEGDALNPQLFTLLNRIKETGKLTKAAALANISYRHGWNLLDQAHQFFGSPVVHLEKGRGATLSPLGEKLLWAEQRVAARLTPQMENLASELNIEIHKEIADLSPILRLHASHGYAVALLPDYALGFQLDLQYKSPIDARTGSECSNAQTCSQYFANRPVVSPTCAPSSTPMRQGVAVEVVVAR